MRPGRGGVAVRPGRGEMEGGRGGACLRDAPPAGDTVECDSLREAGGRSVEPERLPRDRDEAQPHHPLASSARNVAPAVKEVRGVRIALLGPPGDDSSDQEHVDSVDDDFRAEKSGAGPAVEKHGRGGEAWTQGLALRLPACHRN